MRNRKREVCRLCCKTPNDNDQKPIDEIKIEMLEVLQLKLNSIAFQGSVICNDCTSKLEDSFNFKSICLHTEDFLTPFLENNDVLDLKEVYQNTKMSKDSILSKAKYVCRLCMNLAPNDECFAINESKDDINLRVMLEKCLPELNLKATVDNSVCKQCLDSLEKYYSFSISCVETEEKQAVEFLAIEKTKYSEDKCCETPTNPTVEVSSFEFLNESNFKIEQGEMKFEEGTQSLIGMDLSHQQYFLPEQSYTCAKYDYSTKISEPLDNHYLLHNIKNKHACHLCAYESNNKEDLIEHILTHDTPDTTTLHQCHLCPFQTKYPKTLSTHITKHNPNISRDKKNYPDTHSSKPRDLEPPKDKCAHCPYTTSNKLCLHKHSVTHKDPEQTKMFQCPNCSFQSKRKDGITKHMITHVKPGEVELFHCDQCEFTTKYARSLRTHAMVHKEATFSCLNCQRKFKLKSGLAKHMLTHQSDDQRKLYKCQICDYKCKQKPSLDQHMVCHKRPDEVETFGCSLCAFRTIRKPKLKVHMRTHLSRDELVMHKCPECDYETKYKYNLRHHLLKHRTAFEATMYKCPTCNYRTKYQGALKIHIKNHQGALQVFECNACDYKGTSKGNLNKHVNNRHKSEEAVRIFSCEQCEFRTRYKSSLKLHEMVHDESSETTVYRCNECAYETKQKRLLYKHVAFHKSGKKYTCDFCGVTINRGSNFRRHLEMCVEGRF